ncbi:MAG: acetyl-CoA carboxylase biotin carboxyl carrier protein [Planctomycetes bacterium]|nr:acetyl-CoA carboxylase biotin carboxyl carrier protein [Planctomycetota bacterium]
MDLRKLKSLLELMDQHSLSEMDVEEDGIHVKLRKLSANAPVIAHTQSVPPIQAVPQQMVTSATVSPAAVQQENPPQKPREDRSVQIKSPMVGTFYRSAKPDVPAFVEVGKRVEPETVVCILEAMKVMNEIKAECTGTVAEFLVQNGEAVEFGQPMIRVTPA